MPQIEAKFCQLLFFEFVLCFVFSEPWELDLIKSPSATQY